MRLAAQLLRALHLVRGKRVMWETIAHMLTESEIGLQSMEELQQSVESATYANWLQTLQKHRDADLTEAQSGLSEEDLIRFWKKRAQTVQDQLGKRAKKAQGHAAYVEQASTREVDLAEASGRPAAIGSYRCGFPDRQDSRTVASGEVTRIREWKAGLVQMEHDVSKAIPTRRTKHVCADTQGKKQLQKIKDLKIGRILAAGDKVVFSLRTLMDGTRGEEGRPTTQELEALVHRRVAPTMLCAPSGHQWMAALTQQGKLEVAPFDTWQCAHALQSEWSAPHVQTMIDEGMISESQMRSLYGQATSGAAMKVVIGRLRERLTGRWAKDVGAIGAVGAGLNLTALQVAQEMSMRVAWMMEGCPIAGPAGERLAKELGHDVQLLGEATDSMYAAKSMRVALEVLTLRCAPFVHGDGTEAALRELRAVLEATAVRRPRAIIYENTAGLWEKAEMRDRVEMLLQRCEAYRWESMRVSPHKHCGVGVVRERVFYVGIMQGYEKEGVKEEGSEESEAAEEEEEGEWEDAASGAEDGVQARRALAAEDMRSWGEAEAQGHRAHLVAALGRGRRRSKAVVTLEMEMRAEAELKEHREQLEKHPESFTVPAVHLNRRRAGKSTERGDTRVGTEELASEFRRLRRAGMAMRVLETQRLQAREQRRKESRRSARARRATRVAKSAISKTGRRGKDKKDRRGGVATATAKESRGTVKKGHEQKAAVIRLMATEVQGTAPERQKDGATDGQDRGASDAATEEGAAGLPRKDGMAAARATELGAAEARRAATAEGRGNGKRKVAAVRGEQATSETPVWLRAPTWAGTAPVEMVQEAVQSARAVRRLDRRALDHGRLRCICGLARCVCGLEHSGDEQD